MKTTTSDEGNEISLYSPSLESGPKTAYYYIPNGAFSNPPLFTEMKEEEGMWRELRKVIENYESISAAFTDGRYERRPYYLNLEGMRLTYQHFFKVAPDAQGWIDIEQKVASENSKIYDSNYAQLYTQE